MNQLTVGMIGVNGWGACRRGLMRQSGAFRIAAVCDRNAEALARAAAEEGAEAYADYSAMLQHPGLKAVVISTGADSHAPLAIQAMQAGLHVFVEKPLCCSVAEVEALRRAQRETGRIVGVGHNHCPSDMMLALARDYMDSGRLGTVVAFEENSSHSGGLEIQPGEWRGLRANNPGGMLFQCGVHALHSLSYLFGPVTALQALMRYDANPNTETADTAAVLLQTGSGVVGTLNCYHVTAYCHELRIFGTAGNLYFDTHRRLAWFQKGRRGPVEEREPLTIPAGNASGAYANLLSWHDGIRKGTPVYPGLEDGVNAVLPVFAAALAEREGRRVALAEIVAAAADMEVRA
jgi:UDP-N-acetyl-2-amino-2-deoxyglucuronate dehydrogenase